METGGGAVSGGSLQKEISRREAFERKNAELEGVNDELRLENGELRTQVQMLMKKLEEMASKLKGAAGLSLGTNTPEGHRKSTKDHKTKLTLKKQSSLQVHSESEDQETEVHTLRREKKELKDELEQTKTKQLNFEAAFQTEFDLRSTMEEKYDSLRDRYERLVIENDELRRLLRQHSILPPPPPTLRAKLRVITDGPMKPPRRKKRALSLQPEGRPKDDSRSDKCLSQEFFPQDTQSASTELLPSSPLQNSTSTTEQSHFLNAKELSTISGSTEITTKAFGQNTTEDMGRLTTKESEQKEANFEEDNCSSGLPLQTTHTTAEDQRKFQTHSTEDTTKPQSSPSSDHSPISTESTSQHTGQEKSDKSQESVGVIITISAESQMTNMSEQHPKQNLIDCEVDLQTIASDDSKVDGCDEGKAVHMGSDFGSEDGQKQQNTSAKGAVTVALKEGEKTTEWELDSLMASSAQQLESAKAFYAQMHAHLKEKQPSDNDSDESLEKK